MREMIAEDLGGVMPSGRFYQQRHRNHGTLLRIAAEMIHSQIDDCVDYPPKIPLWFRHQNNAERRAVNEALKSLALQIRRTVDGGSEHG
jgi:hypothetical protein